MNCRATDMAVGPGRIRRVIHVAIHVTQFNAREARKHGVTDVYSDAAPRVQILNRLVEPAAADHFLAIWRAGCRHAGASCREGGDYLTDGIKPPWGIIDVPAASVAAAG